jgi:hypothetical protein
MPINVVIESFKSLSHLISELGQRPNNEVMRNANSSQNTDDNEWAGTKSYAEAVALALGGWSDPLSSLKRGLITAERKTLQARRCKTVNDIVGYTANVPAAVIGLPQDMIRSDVEPKKSKIIDLVYSPDANGGTPASTIEKAGIAVLSIVNNLEKSGYRVALSIAFYVGTKGDDRTIATVKIKDWRQPIDLKKIAFPMCNASMLRRIGFKWLETCNSLKESGWAHGYGACPSYEEAKKLLKQNKTLSETQFFINIDLCKKNDFDADKIIAACGLKVR